MGIYKGNLISKVANMLFIILMLNHGDDYNNLRMIER